MFLVTWAYNFGLTEQLHELGLETINPSDSAVLYYWTMLHTQTQSQVHMCQTMDFNVEAIVFVN